MFRSLHVVALVALTACGEPPGDIDSSDSVDIEGEQDGTCPAHGHQQGNDCVCDEGYVPNVQRTACVLEDTETDCPENSHHEIRNGEAGCYCDDGYVVNDAGNACVPADEGCPDNSHYDLRDGQAGCYCDPGYIVDEAGTSCVLPEDECPEGRPSVTINGTLLVCCPPEATAATYRDGQASCVCPEGSAYDRAGNACG
jgi:hypothetical protein